MRLPSTFFLRLDSHQAAIVVGVFELLFHVPFFVLLVLIQVVVNPNNVDFYNALVKEFENEEEKIDTLMHAINFFKFVELFNIIAIGLMVYAVLYRKRWFVLPWFVITAIDVLGMIYQYGTLVDLVLMLNTAVMGVILLTTFYFMVLSIEAYSALAVFCSFREIGIANSETPNRDHDITVQFQPIDNNRGGLV